MQVRRPVTIFQRHSKNVQSIARGNNLPFFLATISLNLSGRTMYETVWYLFDVVK